MTWEPCGYGCGKPWRRWAGSKLLGHARCAMNDEQKLALLARVENDPKESLKTIAAAHGVSYSVVNAWLNTARKLRRAAEKAKSARLP